MLKFFVLGFWFIAIWMKIGGVIDWSWWALTSPVWLGGVFFLGMCLGIGLGMRDELKAVARIKRLFLRKGLDFGSVDNAEQLADALEKVVK